MPTLMIEDPGVQQFVWDGPKSVVQHYLTEGIDGWRLDVAYDLGPSLLHQLSHAAHTAKHDSAVIGEISGYPSDWFPAVDGVFNFFSLKLAEDAVNGKIAGGRVGRMWAQSVEDSGIDHLLKCWLVADNHDTARLANEVPDLGDRKIIHALQLTLPGAPVLYYGSELGMTGSGDPENRAPMRWDLANDQNEELAWIQKLTKFRKEHRAIRVGDFRSIETDRLMGFTRYTDKIRDLVVVLTNPTNQEVTETISPRAGRIQSWGELKDFLTGKSFRCINGLCEIKMKPKSIYILTPVTDQKGYEPYERIP